MKGSVEERALSLGSYIATENATVRSAAKKFGISKSTVHKDVTNWNGIFNEKMININTSVQIPFAKSQPFLLPLRFNPLHQNLKKRSHLYPANF